MKIYTRTGDSGETGLAGGGRIAKDSLRVECIGTIDELNACLGLVISCCSLPASLESPLHQIQSRLFDAGAVVASREGYDCGVQITADDANWLEHQIDELAGPLPELRQFLLPGGHPAAAHSHLARAVCRRAERLVVRLQKETDAELHDVLVFLNRLSDYLFILARSINALHGCDEPTWSGAAGSDE